MVIHEVPKQGGKQNEIRMVNIPTGYSCLPYPGGLLDQPSYIVDAFLQFSLGERTAAMKQLTK
jgi:hypothetical protein